MYQSGGTNSVSSGQSASALYLGFNAGDNGTYNLSGSGLLSVGFEEYIGDNGTGSFTQSGGTHTVSSFMILGNNAGGSGSYLLNSGLLYVGVGGNANEDIGNSGSGSFTQMDGNHMVSGVLLLGNAAGWPPELTTFRAAASPPLMSSSASPAAAASCSRAGPIR